MELNMAGYVLINIFHDKIVHGFHICLTLYHDVAKNHSWFDTLIMFFLTVWKNKTLVVGVGVMYFDLGSVELHFGFAPIMRFETFTLDTKCDHWGELADIFSVEFKFVRDNLKCLTDE